MKTLKLDLDRLAVETFAAAPEAEPRDGTIVLGQGAVPTAPFCSYVDACPTRLCTSRC